jgi:putative ABC transport system permease protein
LRNGLVVFQFTISILLIVSTAIIYKQIRFFQNKRLGFDREQVIVVKNARMLGNQRQSFKQSLADLSQISSVTGTSVLPGIDYNNWAVDPEGLEVSTLDVILCDPSFDETLKIEMVEGRFFSAGHSLDDTTIILNKAAAQHFGWNEPLGKKIQINDRVCSVIGIIEDFHYRSLHTKIDKLGLLLNSDKFRSNERYIAARFDTHNVRETVKQIKNIWTDFAPNTDFEYVFLDDEYDRLYRNEQRTGNLSLLFSMLTIMISALGMFGLASFASEQRTKEIGIRKVLGASVPDVLFLFSREFLKWVLISNLLAWPIAYFLMQKWLQNFAYRTPLGIGIFFLAALISLFITVTSVFYQSMKSALSNPVKSLRYE